MAFIEIKDVRIVGMAISCPKNIVKSEDAICELNDKDTSSEKFIEQVGIRERRLSKVLTATDLACESCEKLLADLKWEKETIDAIVMVSITPDYPLPVNACMLQDRLGLNKECYAQDISMGCSGWVYGLSAVASLLRTGHMKRALLITGDSKMNWGQGNNNLLIGHASSATALEYTLGADGFKFHLGTDGSGANSLIMPKSGTRNVHYTKEDLKLYDDPSYSYSMEAEMNSMDIFSFSITRVPQTIKAISDRFGSSVLDYDYLVLHQANKSINDHIVKKLKVDSSKVISSIELFGNTLSTSIPLTIVTQLKGKLENQSTKLLCSGFGVGLSWGTVSFETEKIVVSDLVEVEDSRFEDLKWV